MASNSLGMKCFPMAAEKLNKKGQHLRVNKLVLHGNHTLHIEMDTGSCEINARLSTGFVSRALPPAPPDSMLVCSVGPHLIQKRAFISHRCARGCMTKLATLSLRGAGEDCYRPVVEMGVYFARTGS